MTRSVTRDKRIDLQKRQTSRNVFSCHLVGPENAGKSSFMRRFLRKSLQQSKAKTEATSRTSFSNYVVNTVQIYGQTKYLIVSPFDKFNYSYERQDLLGLQIREIDLLSLEDRLTEPELMCDVSCLMYDSTDPKSFEFIANAFLVSHSKTSLLSDGLFATQEVLSQHKAANSCRVVQD